MANRAKPKRKKVGYITFIKRDEVWVKVGFLFGFKNEALEWLNKNYPNNLNRRIQAARVSISNDNEK